jgi:two-component system response regulator QseB
MHILLIEDDMDLGAALQQALKLEGISSEWLRRTVDTPSRLERADFDCVLLDLSLPDGSGFDLLSRWRHQGSAVPIVVITARSSLEDRLTGLDGGADDFVVKPFATAELLSRIRAVCRRSAHQASEEWTFGEMCIEPRRFVATLNGLALDLSPREFRLLLELARETGAVVPKGTLAKRLDPLGDPVDFATVEVHMSNLRRKIGAHRVVTVHGVGYYFQP